MNNILQALPALNSFDPEFWIEFADSRVAVWLENFYVTLLVIVFFSIAITTAVCWGIDKTVEGIRALYERIGGGRA